MLILTTVIAAPPVARLRMPVATSPDVELACEMEITYFMLCVGYNIGLVILCAAHAFLTRHLPDNFNESWYLFVSVSTTSFLWLVFLPSYFTTFHSYYKTAILAFCLFVNGACTLVCLFLPKVYAIYFVGADHGIETGSRSYNTNQVGITNRRGVSY